MCSMAYMYAFWWLQLVDEFVAAMLRRWPKAVLQFEDFNQQHARPLLERYRDNYLVFNDDIQVNFCLDLV